ncbi:hypothetical protein J437_LFUL008266 [Ladona fulva]|uniref:Uncharacterized protein n=1 Tax=Ladona fulva TaxID=123851 RepID=A0A8K0K9X5_LADFU|nr:hypothetical protein J437_LFUL008266 [Ladona fulva]
MLLALSMFYFHMKNTLQFFSSYEKQSFIHCVGRFLNVSVKASLLGQLLDIRSSSGCSIQRYRLHNCLLHLESKVLFWDQYLPLHLVLCTLS